MGTFVSEIGARQRPHLQHRSTVVSEFIARDFIPSHHIHLHHRSSVMSEFLPAATLHITFLNRLTSVPFHFQPVQKLFFRLVSHSPPSQCDSTTFIKNKQTEGHFGSKLKTRNPGIGKEMGAPWHDLRRHNFEVFLHVRVDDVEFLNGGKSKVEI